MADASTVIGLLQVVFSAVLAAGISAGIGYYKKTEREKWDWYLFGRTVFVAVVLVPAAGLLGLDIATPGEVVEARLMEIGAYGLFVYAAEASFVLLWRRVLAPVYERVKQLLASR